MKTVRVAFLMYTLLVLAAIAEWLVFRSPRFAIGTLVLAAVAALGQALWRTFRA
jgi:hypothetical protein